MSGIANDRNRHAWHLALAGLRRGEIAGQRWADVDLEKANPADWRDTSRCWRPSLRPGRAKDSQRRSCPPHTGGSVGGLAAAKNRQASEKLALGEAYTDRGYVVCNEAGEPYHPSTLSRLWRAAIRDLSVPQIRLHDARHTCATLMHLQAAPIALVAAWLGHADVSFTLRTYVRAQPEALELAARSFAPPAANSSD